jgi:hypothetical protein
VAIGGQALYTANGGSANTAVGSQALYGLTTGYENTAIGTEAGYAGATPDTTGTYNTFIGSFAQASSGALTNATAIGNGAIVTGSNRVQIGNSAVTTIYLGAATGTSYTYSTGGIITNSDRRLKKDIRDSDLGLDFIKKLQPVSYVFKKGDGSERYGFIAQDVEKAIGHASGIVTRQDDPAKTYGLNYTDLISPVVKAVQQIYAKLEALEKIVEGLIARFNPLEKMVHEQQDVINKQQSEIESLTKSVTELKSEVETMKNNKKSSE